MNNDLTPCLNETQIEGYFVSYTILESKFFAITVVFIEAKIEQIDGHNDSRGDFLKHNVVLTRPVSYSYSNPSKPLIGFHLC